jgi:hypothetical protein|tara:strand:+ start:341 stop:508 length:168 start_codon:yes stop_codon:yes gene_type:complete
MYYDIDYSLLIHQEKEEKKQASKPTVERKNTPQEKKYNEFVKKLYSKSKSKKKKY